jgi:hypothetical protein
MIMVYSPKKSGGLRGRPMLLETGCLDAIGERGPGLSFRNRRKPIPTLPDHEYDNRS